MEGVATWSNATKEVSRAADCSWVTPLGLFAREIAVRSPSECPFRVFWWAELSSTDRVSFFFLRFVVVVVVVVVIVVVGFHVFGRILLLNGSENCRCGFAMDGLWSRRVFLWLEFFFYRPAWGLFGGLSLFLFLFLFVLQFFLFKNRIGKGWLKVKVWVAIEFPAMLQGDQWDST